MFFKSFKKKSLKKLIINIMNLKKNIEKVKNEKITNQPIKPYSNPVNAFILNFNETFVIYQLC